MNFERKNLIVRKSQIPGAGKGLFTRVFIPKDTFIIEYEGDVVAWKEVKDEYDNDYIYYVNSQHVINARHRLDAIARYINDAAGMKKTPGLSNNCVYKKVGTKVFVQAIRDIEARSELLVSYGKEYWETGKRNAEIAAREQRKKR